MRLERNHHDAGPARSRKINLALGQGPPPSKQQATHELRAPIFPQRVEQKRDSAELDQEVDALDHIPRDRWAAITLGALLVGGGIGLGLGVTLAASAALSPGHHGRTSNAAISPAPRPRVQAPVVQPQPPPVQPPPTATAGPAPASAQPEPHPAPPTTATPRSQVAPSQAHASPTKAEKARPRARPREIYVWSAKERALVPDDSTKASDAQPSRKSRAGDDPFERARPASPVTPRDPTIAPATTGAGARERPAPKLDDDDPFQK